MSRIPMVSVFGGLLACAATTSLMAQPGPAGQPAPAVNPSLPQAVPGDQVVVKREAPQLLAPQNYKAPLFLEPVTMLTISAPLDGLVRQVTAKPGDKVIAQGELVRFESTPARLKLARADALYKLAVLEQRDAGKESGAESAKLKTEAAKAELDLAQYFVDQSTQRAPFAGEVLRVLVTEGEYVRAGQPLVQFGDLSKMKVEIPVSRAEVNVDQSFTVVVDSKEVTGKVQSVLPLAAKFDPLRDLFESIASAAVVLDNADGKLKPGQSVFTAMMPRNPVAQVSTGAIGNTGDGQRKVQVLRQGVVRDVPVQLLGSVGPTRTYVSGALMEGDEVIYESSHLLADGFQLKSAAATSTAKGTTNAAQPGATPAPAAPVRSTKPMF